MSFNRLTAMLLVLTSTAGAAVAAEDSLSADDRQFFENKIRPALVKYCYECHSEKAAELGGRLLLDSRDGMLTGGESGPVLVSKQPDKSLLIQAIKYDVVEMPPDQPLPEAVVSDFIEWVRRGAPDPRTKPQTSAQPAVAAADEAVTLWSLQPITTQSVPAVQDSAWPRGAIDHFVLSAIEAAELHPTRDADPRSLVRRLSFDLTGLPPSLAEIESFVAECETDRVLATERLVDRLLATRQYGERWARFWLDVARYGESNGNDGLSRNPSFPHAWRYRDYVIDAFNHDVPFDRFVREQVAGDLLPYDSAAEHDRQAVATGFLAIGSKPAKAMNSNFAMDVVADQIDAIGRGLLGLSVGCARCHDHKFDPIPTRDYYALAGIFTSSETLWGVAANEALAAPATDLIVLKAAPKVLPPADFEETVLVLDSNTGMPKKPPKSKWAAGTPLAMGLRDRSKPEDAKINIKGESSKTGDAVPRGFLSACEIPDCGEIGENQSGRLQLAEWITHRAHPLTSRVLVNRVWLQLFGEGIVGTPDDFGVYGDRPTHPELLDHLATQFMDDGWSMKKLVRTIVLSRTYQLACDAPAELLERDPQLRLLTRHRLRRLTAESLRDAMLAASGQLDLTPGDGSLIRHRDILVNRAGNLHEPSTLRSIYLCYLRNSPPPELAAFDLPDFTAVLGKRDVSTIPGQALHLYNNPFVIEQASQLARLVTDDTADPHARIRLAWERAFGRAPADHERQQALELVRATEDELNSEQAWLSLCQALLVSNEFRYVD